MVLILSLIVQAVITRQLAMVMCLWSAHGGSICQKRIDWIVLITMGTMTKLIMSLAVLWMLVVQSAIPERVCGFTSRLTCTINVQYLS